MDTDEIRADIPGLAETVYLNTGGTGPSPQCVTDAVVDAYRYIQARGPDARPVKGWLSDQMEVTRDRLASFLGVSSDEIALLRSVSEGMNVVASGLAWQEGDEILLTDQEHPTGLLPWFNLRDRAGVTLKMVPLTDDRQELLKRIEEAITPRTHLLSMSHVTAENGLRLPAKEITDLAHSRDVQVLFDGAQSAGQFPIDLRQIGCDYYAMTGHKWLLGGLGVGALYIRSDRIDDLAVSWSGAGAVEELDRVTGEFRWQPGARRFEFGGRSRPLYFGLDSAVDYLQRIGPDQIEARAGELADGLKQELASIPNVTVLSPAEPSMSSGIVCFEISGVGGNEVVDALWERWQIVSRAAFQGRAIRLSVAFFTSPDELQTVIEAVRQVADERT